MSHDRYDSTRQAWENIWQEADVLVELEAVQSARSLETIALYEAHLPKDDLILEAGSGLGAVVMTLRQRATPSWALIMRSTLCTPLNSFNLI